MVPFEEDLGYDEHAMLMEGIDYLNFLPEHTNVIYTYDLGDHWEHEIQLVRVIEEYDMESPYLLEAIGLAPPEDEDVGGVGGLVDFREIMLKSSHLEHQDMKEWAGYWTMELSDWKSQPKVIKI